MTYRTHDQVASEFIAEGQRRRITPRGIVICIATGLVESNNTVYANSKVPESLALPHDAVGSDGFSVGPLQQQVRKGANGQWWWGDAATCMDPTKSAGLFYDRLAKLDYNGPNSPGSYAQAVQQSAFPDRYDQRMADAQSIYNRLVGAPAVVDPNKPGYNEFPIWSDSNQDRSGTKVDLFLLHTQEGGGGNAAAVDLANYLANPANQVSYHYTVSQASDGSVTVVDVVDTDLASWSVLSANNRSINLCFAGSRAAWTRDQWVAQSKAIDVAAYLAVQDCKKYGISTNVVPPPYTSTPGISDHYYVTKVLGDGTHTDVGPNFPWDVFAAAVQKYSGAAPPPPPPVTPDYLKEIWEQLRGPGGNGWKQLGGRTLVDAVAELLKGK